MVHPNTMTVNPQTADEEAVVLTAEARKFEHIHIRPHLRSWVWVHQTGKPQRVPWGDGYGYVVPEEQSRQDFPSPLAAAAAGAIEAHTLGVPAILPRHLEPELMAMWREQGRQKYHERSTIESCWNEHQRAGYQEAALEPEMEIGYLESTQPWRY